MTKAAIRKLGGSHFVVVPPVYLRQSGLSVGATVDLTVRGDVLTLKPDHHAARVPSLEVLIRATPKGARVKGWDEMAPAGNEMS